jgi:pimeloyl-ACP methyl ester carboxylesterase
MPDAVQPPANTPSQAPQILSRPDGSSIAYHRTPKQPATAAPGVVFIHGFMSDMDGGKAVFLEGHCRRRGLDFVRFDQFGHGKSSGAFADGSVGRWAEDTVAVLDALTDGPQILVGSSCGGWLMLLAALARPQRVAGLVGLAPAPDFTEDLVWPEFTDEQREAVLRDGHVLIPSNYSDQPYTFTKRLFDDGRRNLVLRDEIAFDGPVRILHGQKDDAIPWQRSLLLMDRLRSTDVACTFLKNSDHRLSELSDLARMAATVDELVAAVR